MTFRATRVLERGDILVGYCKGVFVSNEQPSFTIGDGLEFSPQGAQITLLSKAKDVTCGQIVRTGLFGKVYNLITSQPNKHCVHSGWVCKVVGHLGFYLIDDVHLEKMEKIGKELI